MKLLRLVILMVIFGGFVVGGLAQAADDDDDSATQRGGEGGRSNQKSTVFPKQSSQDTDGNKLRQELSNLEKELKRLVIPPQSKANHTTKKQKALQSRIRAIQSRIEEIQGKSRTPSKRPASFSTERLDAEVNALQQEIDKANEAITIIAELNPASEELKMLKRRVVQKQRTLNALVAQRKRTEDQQDAFSKDQEDSAPKTDLRRLEIFALKHASAEYAAELVHPLLTKDSGIIAFDINTNSVIIKDVPQVLKEIQRILNHIDVSPTEK